MLYGETPNSLNDIRHTQQYVIHLQEKKKHLCIRIDAMIQMPNIDFKCARLLDLKREMDATQVIIERLQT